MTTHLYIPSPPAQIEHHTTQTPCFCQTVIKTLGEKYLVAERVLRLLNASVSCEAEICTPAP